MSQKIPICIEFGRAIRLLRKKKGFSQEGFADAARVHRTFIGGIERGERNPTLETVEKIAAALKIPIAKIFDEIHSSRE